MSEGDPGSSGDEGSKPDALDALIGEKDGTSAASFIHQLQIVAQAGGRIEELFVRVEALEELDRLHPFGQGNPEPVFGLRAVRLDQAPRAFGEGNFRFRMPSDGRSKNGIAWPRYSGTGSA